MQNWLIHKDAIQTLNNLFLYFSSIVDLFPNIKNVPFTVLLIRITQKTIAFAFLQTKIIDEFVTAYE